MQTKAGRLHGHSKNKWEGLWWQCDRTTQGILKGKERPFVLGAFSPVDALQATSQGGRAAGSWMVNGGSSLARTLVAEGSSRTSCSAPHFKTRKEKHDLDKSRQC